MTKRGKFAIYRQSVITLLHKEFLKIKKTNNPIENRQFYRKIYTMPLIGSSQENI